MAYLYTIAYLTSLFGLIFWYQVQGNKKQSRLMSSLFLGGYITYALALTFADGLVSAKMLILARDMFVMAVVSQIFNYSKNNKLSFAILFVFLILAVKFFYFNKLTSSFVQLTNSVEQSGIKISDEWEFLFEIQNAEVLENFNPIIEKYDLSIQRAFDLDSEDISTLDEYYLLGIPEKSEYQISTIKEKLQSTLGVIWVEENEIISIDPVETNSISRSPINYGINDPELDKLWGFEKMNVQKLFPLIKNHKKHIQQKSLLVILDTGIDAKHEDLKGNYRSIKSKYDTDGNMHGTHCAGIAASVNDNGLGIASFNANNSLYDVSSIKVLSSMGSGTQHVIINGLIEAADNGADVISMSLGGRSSHVKQRAYNKAIEYANKKGAIVVVAAGNANIDAIHATPANAKGVITVSAINEEMDKALFSNTVQSLDMGIAAPGKNIYSTVPNNEYKSLNGTSMATPYVSAVIAMLKAFKPDLKTKEAFDLLNKTGIETKASTLTGPLVQPSEALSKLLQ